MSEQNLSLNYHISYFKINAFDILIFNMVIQYKFIFEMIGKR